MRCPRAVLKGQVSNPTTLLWTRFTCGCVIRYASAAAVLVARFAMVAGTLGACFVRGVEAHLNITDVAHHHWGLLALSCTAPANVKTREVVFNCSLSFSIVENGEVYVSADWKTWIGGFDY